VILLVEDELGLRTIMQKVLQQCGYSIIPAGNGVEALQLWARYHDDIDLLLTDMVMPEGLSGVQLAQKIRMEKPDLKVIYTSGLTAEGLASHGEHLVEGANFLQKPFRRDTLAGAVRRLLHSEE